LVKTVLILGRVPLVKSRSQRAAWRLAQSGTAGVLSSEFDTTQGF